MLDPACVVDAPVAVRWRSDGTKQIMHGLPVLAGTRIPVQLIVRQLAAGESIEAVMQAYALTQEQVRTALGYAAERVAAETVYVVSDR